MRRTLPSLLLLPFSLYYWSVAFLWMGIVCSLSFILSFFLPYQKIHSWIAAPGFKLCIFLGLNDIKISYDPEFDPQRRSVFCQNHVNLLDAFVASATIPHAFCGLMHAWQFRIPIYGWMMSISKGIKVYPDRKNNLDSMIAQAKDRKNLDFSILAFPEGGRTRDGKVHKFRRGIFFMAREAAYPVVPIAVRGSYAINQRGSRFFRPFQTIEVHVGPQFETQTLTDQHVDELSKKLQNTVANFVEAA